MAAAPIRTERRRETADRWIGRVIASRYRLESRLGAGTGGKVYRATELERGTDVALKIVEVSDHADPAEDEAFRERAVALMGLDHPGIPRLLDFGRDGDGVRFAVMVRAEGAPLDEVLREQGRLEFGLAVEIALQLAAAIQHAHIGGLIHRDLKPSNILLSKESVPRVALLDFGIAAPPGEGGASGIQGSPAYAAPGQANGDAADPRDDVYSLGVIVYELVTGRLPFEDDSPIGVVMQHLQQDPKPPRMLEGGIPRSLEAAILKALAKDRGARFQSMAEWIAILEATRDELAAKADPPEQPASWMTDAWARFVRKVGW
ncbi:MAG TPA: serine/threonine-protein kinase [Vulgatibacter sp.]